MIIPTVGFTFENHPSACVKNSIHASAFNKTGEINTMPFHKPGRLVSYRDREWMVLPSSDPEILKLKPLGGSDHEITGVFLPLNIPGEDITEARFPWPSCDHLGNFETARLLYDASRLLFRNAAGPFRAMGKLSFQPRAYQMVPLVMSLKQKRVRLLIADDVGVGKTIESLIILQELIERGDIQKFAVICPPHLCEQWQKELSDKIDIKAQIIRSSTAASLDRQLPDDRSIFYHLPYQVISIDYIKMGKRRSIFLNDCPECVIVDEAHICTLPEGGSTSQKQRYSLIADIAKDPQKHMLFLTATPHSGKDSEFVSLLGFLNHEFLNYDFANIKQSQRRKIASYFIQRKRKKYSKMDEAKKPHFLNVNQRRLDISSWTTINLFIKNYLILRDKSVSSEKEEKQVVSDIGLLWHCSGGQCPALKLVLRC
ncbi:MAG: hypothetical protein OMM_04407 [Candidatus Magnetoglobus multicellularis str. Araruama]|uniref:Helicase ATP-binding domain-containing protein n=1 Tax=Candidatus Magnetoglobus multicellularis str. Araruama TaxID=890399 RepID=A0A1V1P1N0_9BACT|nr:MAG: hypothetical protein OMM_04407 [Candidatus Magnetoglobus multicellularis str. Araruama]